MPSDLAPSAECALIEAYVRLLAPAIHALSCGTRLDGGYEVWLQLNPRSVMKVVTVTKAEFETEEWKQKIIAAVEDANV
jgi:hypothetical protein